MLCSIRRPADQSESGSPFSPKVRLHVAAETSRPLRRDAARNRGLILDAAQEAFAEHGLGVTLDEIADRAGVGIGTVYRRFADKDALIDALGEHWIDLLISQAEQALAGDDAWV